MYKNIEKQKVLHMAEQVDYQDGQIVSRTLVQNSKLSMTLFAFEKDEEISTHAAGGDAMVTVLEGTGRFTVGGEVFLVSQGETLIMPKDIPHAVYGQERFRSKDLVQDPLDLAPKAPARCVHHFCVRPQKFHTCGLRGILTDAPVVSQNGSDLFAACGRRTLRGF